MLTLILSCSLKVSDVRKYIIYYLSLMKGSSQGLDAHINVKSEKPVSGSDFTTTDLFRGNDLSWVNNVFKCAH